MRKSLLALVALTLIFSSAQAQGMEAPVDVQIPLLFKILTFDRNLADRAPGQDIIIAVVFQTDYHSSVAARDHVVDALALMKNSTISGHRVTWVMVELTSPAALRLDLQHKRVDVVYLTPLRGVDLVSITAITRAAQVTTFTGVPHYVDQGLALGVGIAHDRPQILVNLPAARAEGSDFSSQLLRVSKVVE